MWEGCIATIRASAVHLPIESKFFAGVVGLVLLLAFRTTITESPRVKRASYGVVGLVGARLTATNFCEAILLARSLALVWMF